MTTAVRHSARSAACALSANFAGGEIDTRARGSARKAACCSEKIGFFHRARVQAFVIVFYAKLCKTCVYVGGGDVLFMSVKWYRVARFFGGFVSVERGLH